MTPGRRRYLAAGAALVVVVAVVLGIRAIGSPGEAREIRLDQRRVELLQEISRAVETYHAREKRLPSDLAALASVSGAQTTDPVSGEPFEYHLQDARQYELCAVFSRRTPAGEGSSFWWHDAGRQCYGFRIREDDR